MFYSCQRYAIGVSMMGMRMALRHKFLIVGCILGFILVLKFAVPSETPAQGTGNTILNSDYEDENGNIEASKRFGLPRDVHEVLLEAEKENKMVEEVLRREGGERDLLSLGEREEKGGELHLIKDTQNKIKNLEELIKNLEQRKKELSVKVVKKKKKSKKKKKRTKQTVKPEDSQKPTGQLVTKKEKPRANCSSYENEAKMARQVIPFMLGGNSSVSRSDITFATHLSIARLDMLEEVMKHWSGPLSVALVSTPDTAAQLTTSLNRIRAFSQGRVQLHVVASTGVYYPANFLRNVALNNTKTDYVFLSDADFIPMYGAHKHIQTAIGNGLLDDPQTKRALVVPAFEFLKTGPAYPKTKQELINLWNEEKAFPFHYNLKPAHGPTNFTKWRNTSTPYVIKWKQYFEPYVVMKTSETPRYHEGFIGREFNKISQLMEVQARGFEFLVLPDTFTIHLPHRKSGTTRTNYRCAVRLYRIFQKNLRRKFHAHV